MMVGPERGELGAGLEGLLGTEFRFNLYKGAERLFKPAGGMASGQIQTLPNSYTYDSGTRCIAPNHAAPDGAP
jgi:hypothetical protein